MSGPTPKTPRKGSFFRTIMAVAWGFLGVRKRSDYQEDFAKITPLHILAVGLLAAILLVGGLVMLVKFVVAS